MILYFTQKSGLITITMLKLFFFGEKKPVNYVTGSFV